MSLTGRERYFGEDEIIVSKTDARGIITYANHVFLRIADYRLEEVLGKPHNLIRHPAMPRCIFKLLWTQIKQGKEIFAYVVNRTKFGDYYWVFAHVTPTLNEKGEMIGYHSNRRSPKRAALQVIEPLYMQLVAEEKRHATPKEGTDAAYEMLLGVLAEKGMGYDEFILSL